MTFSIVAHDPGSGELGAAMASFTFATGSLGLSARPGSGIVITQMIWEPSYGVAGLNRMQAGECAEAVLTSLVAADAGRAQRQLAFLDPRGNASAYTGAGCVAYAGHRAEQGISAQGAMLLNPGIWDGMYAAFESADGTLGERLLVALEEGYKLGGDLRGHRSAALLVVRAKASDMPWRDRIIDLRVDDHSDPIAELRRLYHVQQLAAASNAAFEMALSGKLPQALVEFSGLQRQAPGDADIALRHGILLALSGDIVSARRRFEVCYAAADEWRELVRRLGAAGFIPEDPKLL